MRKVAVIMGSTSDLPVAEKAIQTLKEYGIETEVRVLSAHRCPNEAREFAASARESGFSCIIALAGMAAHLAGRDGREYDASRHRRAVQRREARRHGRAALDRPDAERHPRCHRRYRRGENAAILAVQIMAVSDEGLAHKLQAARDEGTAAVLKADEELRERYKN